MKRLYLIFFLSFISIHLEIKPKLSRHKKHVIKSKINRQSRLVRAARIIAGSCACAAGAFCLKGAHTHIRTAIFHANGVGFFFKPSNWWPLLKTCWFVSKFGETAAFVAPLLPVVGDWDGHLSTLYEAPARIELAKSCLNSAAWLSAALSFSIYGLKSLYKATRTETKKKKVKQ